VAVTDAAADPPDLAVAVADLPGKPLLLVLLLLLVLDLVFRV
jgi:hypothetical protein